MVAYIETKVSLSLLVEFYYAVGEENNKCY